MNEINKLLAASDENPQWRAAETTIRLLNKNCWSRPACIREILPKSESFFLIFETMKKRIYFLGNSVWAQSLGKVPQPFTLFKQMYVFAIRNDKAVYLTQILSTNFSIMWQHCTQRAIWRIRKYCWFLFPPLFRFYCQSFDQQIPCYAKVEHFSDTIRIG